MKVCIISDGLPYQHGGAQLRAYHHSLMLNEAGIPTQLIAWNRGEPPEDAGSLPKFIHPVKLSVDPHRSTTGSPQVLRTTAHLAEINLRLGKLLYSLRKEFDLLHIINAGSLFSLSTTPWGKLLNKPVIIEIVSLGGDDPMTLSMRSHRRGQQLYPHRPLKYTLFLGADAYVCKSPALLETCRQAQISDEKLHLVPSGVDSAQYAPPSPLEKARLREELGLVADQKLILFLGGMDEKKGVRELVEAFHQLTPKHPHSHLLIVGACSRFMDTYHEIQQRIAESGYASNFTITDRFVRNVADFMNAADIYVHPSWREGFSVAILEAMSCGLPIAASDLPTIRGVQIENETHGLLVPPRNPVELAQALAELLNSEDLCDRLGQAARQRVLREFSLERVTSQYLSLYEGLLKPAPSHA